MAIIFQNLHIFYPMKITYFGHSCFLFEVSNQAILVDPFISGNPLAKDIDVDAIRADYIFLTHGHQDHVLDAERIGKKNGSLIVSNFEIVSWYEQAGLKGHPMNHGGTWHFDFGWAKMVNSIHSSVLPDGTYGGNPGGFIFHANGMTWYVAGDTSLTMDMKLIPLVTGALDFAILPVGGNFTMDYTEAVHAADFIQCKDIIGCHFDTFGYVEIDHDQVLNAFSTKKIKLTLPKVGEVLER